MPVIELKPSPSIPLHALDALQDDALLPICCACGTQYPSKPSCSLYSSSSSVPLSERECPICLDPGQYVPSTGQEWTTLSELAQTRPGPGGVVGTASGEKRRHKLLVDEDDERIKMIVTEPSFAIGQTPILIETANGSYIWDCAAFLSLPLIGHLSSLEKPLKGIAISHPHFFATSLTWSRALNVPLYLNAEDKEWYARLDEIRNSDQVVWWTGEQVLGEGVKVFQCGGHFPGSSVLYWDRLSEPAPPADDLPTKPTPVSGILFTADTLMVQPSQKGFSFLWSVPNLIPLRPKAILHIYETLKHIPFAQATSSWPNRFIRSDAKKVLEESIVVYLAAEGWRLEDGPESGIGFGTGSLVELVS